MCGWGACVVVGGMHGCGAACMVAGDMHGCGRVRVWLQRGCVWLWGACMVVGGVHRIRRDTVNEREVRILLECILVWLNFDPVDFPFGISIFVSVFRPYKVQQCSTEHLHRKLQVHILHI